MYISLMRRNEKKNQEKYLSRDLIYQKLHPLRDPAFGADCLTPFLNFENHNSRSKNGFSKCYQVLLHVVKIFRF